ncbi:MAG: hypothetical protein IMZ53_04105 [Thermoplasmata archaeon]|nr:hypothetical protein [Thermoplasmata archaeon]
MMIIISMMVFPEATRIPSYPTGPKGFTQQKEKTDKRVFGERDHIKDL